MKVFAVLVVTSLVCAIIGFLTFVGLSSAGNSGPRSRATAYQADLEIHDHAKHRTVVKVTQPREEDIRRTGTADYNTGRTTQAMPKDIEKTRRLWGKTVSAGNGVITVQAPEGVRTFLTDINTFIGRAGDRHFHPYPGGLDGIAAGTGVSVQFYPKDGREYASWIAVGAEPFAQPAAIVKDEKK